MKRLNGTALLKRRTRRGREKPAPHILCTYLPRTRRLLELKNYAKVGAHYPLTKCWDESDPTCSPAEHPAPVERVRSGVELHSLQVQLLNKLLADETEDILRILQLPNQLLNQLPERETVAGQLLSLPAVNRKLRGDLNAGLAQLSPEQLTALLLFNLSFLVQCSCQLLAPTAGFNTLQLLRLPGIVTLGPTLLHLDRAKTVAPWRLSLQHLHSLQRAGVDLQGVVVPNADQDPSLPKRFRQQSTNQGSFNKPKKTPRSKAYKNKKRCLQAAMQSSTVEPFVDNINMNFNRKLRYRKSRSGWNPEETRHSGDHSTSRNQDDNYRYSQHERTSALTRTTEDAPIDWTVWHEGVQRRYTDKRPTVRSPSPRRSHFDEQCSRSDPKDGSRQYDEEGGVRERFSPWSREGVQERISPLSRGDFQEQTSDWSRGRLQEQTPPLTKNLGSALEQTLPLTNNLGSTSGQTSASTKNLGSNSEQTPPLIKNLWSTLNQISSLWSNDMGVKVEPTSPSPSPECGPYLPRSPEYDPHLPQSPEYDNYSHQSPEYAPYSHQSPQYENYSPQSPSYSPASPNYGSPEHEDREDRKDFL